MSDKRETSYMYIKTQQGISAKMENLLRLTRYGAIDTGSRIHSCESRLVELVMTGLRIICFAHTHKE